MPSTPGLFRPSLCGLAVFAVSLGSLVYCSHGFGLTWDEGTYVSYLDRVDQWIHGGTFAAASLDDGWSRTGVLAHLNPHPPLMRLVSWAGAKLSADALSFPLSYRVGQYTLISLVVGLLAASMVGRIGWGALALPLVTLFQPRIFGQSLMATCDAAVAFAWLGAVLAAVRLLEDGSRRRWGTVLVLSMAWGIASKFPGLLVVLPLGAAMVALRRWALLGLVGLGVLAGFLALAITDIAHWTDPLAGLGHYLTYPFRRDLVISGYYEFKVIGVLPWHYAYHMILATTPLLLLLSAMGATVVAIRARQWSLLPLGLAVLFWLVFVGLPIAPRHDQERQFLPLFPLLGLLPLLAAWPGTFLRTIATRPAVLGVTAAFIVLECASALPFPTMYYSPIVGGIAGAEKAGYGHTLYSESVTREEVEWINRTLPLSSRLVIIPPANAIWQVLQQRGLLRRDLRLDTANAVPAAVPDSPSPTVLLVLNRDNLLGRNAAALRHPLLRISFYQGFATHAFFMVPPHQADSAPPQDGKVD